MATININSGFHTTTLMVRPLFVSSRFLFNVVNNAATALICVWKRHQAETQLEKLSARELKDIGLNRSEIPVVVSAMFRGN
jgi:uncharacterized protein YjiS (DUF1127 family)